MYLPLSNTKFELHCILFFILLSMRKTTNERSFYDLKRFFLITCLLAKQLRANNYINYHLFDNHFATNKIERNLITRVCVFSTILLF